MLFCDINYASLYDQIPKLLTLNIHKEYAHLFLSLKNFQDYFRIHLFFKSKIQGQHKWYKVFSDFMYWLNFNILFFSVGITIPQNSFTYFVCKRFLHTFSWDLSLFYVLKEWRQFKQWKSSWSIDVVPLNNVDNFLLQDNAILFFSLFGIINRIIAFSRVELWFKI